MEKLDPNIILRADIVNPKIVPPALASIYDRLVNRILSTLGIKIGVECFETGWILFFGNISDFRGFFGRPMFSNSREVPTEDINEEDEPVIWEFKFERLPPHPPEESLANIMKRFYAIPGALGAGTFQEISTKERGKRYRISYPSLAAYKFSLEGLVTQAHHLLSSMRGNPNLSLDASN